jgi:zinc metalloprotease ZmpA
MKKLAVLIMSMGLVLSIMFISMSRSEANGSATYERERGEAIERAREASFDLIQTSNSKVRDARSEFRVREAFTDELSMTHVRLDQQYEGVKIFQGELITHFDSKGIATGITGDYLENINISTTPTLSASDAIVMAAKKFGGAFSSEPTAELMILPKDGEYRLAYRVEMVDIDGDSPADMVYFISAKNGKVLFQYDNLQTTGATGKGNSLYLGQVDINTNSITGGFEMRDTARGSSYTTDMKNRTNGNGTIFTDSDNIWGSGTTSSPASAAVDAHFGSSTTFDYYLNVHGRNGIANNGAGAFSRVHYSRRYNNAFWNNSCFCMTYGDGDGSSFKPLVSLDVAAHEMSHGVTSRTANLTYSGESGGINEGTSDIFGTCTEFYAKNAADPGDYLIGEKITLFGPKYLRSMSDPRSDGRSIDHYSQYVSGMDVHYSSGLANHFFYLLSVGGTNRTSGLSVTGIGINKAEKIWYTALTAYMTAGTNYAGARVATLNAASDLYGATSAERAAVAATWTACGVN